MMIHPVEDPVRAVQILKIDAKKLGIEFKYSHLCAYDDGRSEDYPMPDGWRKLLSDIAQQTGMTSVHAIDAPGPALTAWAGVWGKYQYNHC